MKNTIFRINHYNKMTIFQNKIPWKNFKINLTDLNYTNQKKQ